MQTALIALLLVGVTAGLTFLLSLNLPHNRGERS